MPLLRTRGHAAELLECAWPRPLLPSAAARKPGRCTGTGRSSSPPLSARRTRSRPGNSALRRRRRLRRARRESPPARRPQAQPAYPFATSATITARPGVFPSSRIASPRPGSGSPSSAGPPPHRSRGERRCRRMARCRAGSRLRRRREDERRGGHAFHSPHSDVQPVPPSRRRRREVRYGRDTRSSCAALLDQRRSGSSSTEGMKGRRSSPSRSRSRSGSVANRSRSRCAHRGTTRSSLSASA